MDPLVLLTVVTIVVALGFAYTNGFHDASTAVATSVATRALTPRIALAMAAVMNLVGAFLGQGVAATVASVVVPPDGEAGLRLLLAALLGAIAWNLLTWRAGLPSSSSYALLGGLAGAAVAAGATVRWDVVRETVLVAMVASPLVGLLGAAGLMVALLWVFRNRPLHRTQRGFRVAQTVSAAAVALGHGLQDAQKSAAVIVLAMLAGGYSMGTTEDSADLPVWVISLVAVALAAGTLSGGWRIMRTLGRRLVDLDPARGFAAETVAAGVLYTAGVAFDAPVSTTHTLTAAVVGAGSTTRLSAVRWRLARRILLAWVVTVPAAALGAAAVWWTLGLVLG